MELKFPGHVVGGGEFEWGLGSDIDDDQVEFVRAESRGIDQNYVDDGRIKCGSDGVWF